MGLLDSLFAAPKSRRQRKAEALFEELGEKITKENLREKGYTGRIYGNVNVYLDGQNDMGIIEAGSIFENGKWRCGRFLISIGPDSVSVFDVTPKN